MPRHLLTLPQTAASLAHPQHPPQNVLDELRLPADAGPRIATGLSDTSEELSGKTIAPRLSLNSFLKRQSIAIREGSPSGVDNSSVFSAPE
eukprot:scaffold19954_cov105-Isochrysis_galbana.AAC.2